MWWISGLAGAGIRSVARLKAYSRVDIAVVPLTYTGRPQTVKAQVLDRNETPIPKAAATITYATRDGVEVDAPRNAGTYKVTAAYAGDELYDPSSATADLVIGKATKPLVITIKSKTKALGAPVEGLGVTFGGGAIGGEKFVVECETTATADSAPGDYPITLKSINPADLAANYDHQVTNGKLTVTKAKPTIAITSANSVVYDGHDHEMTYTVTGVPNFPVPTATVTYTKGGKPASAPRAIGTYALSINVAGNSSYNEAKLGGQVVITKPTLTVTLPNVTKVYGETVPQLPAPTLTGAISGDTLVATSKTTAKATTPVGKVAITLDAITPPEAADNYNVVVTPGELTISQATPTIDFSVDRTFDYDGQPHKLTATVVGVGTDRLAAPAVTYTNTTTKATVVEPIDAATYDVSAAFGGNVNYKAVTAETQTVIKKIKLKVVYNSKSMTAGDLLPSLDATVTGEAGNDQFQVTGATTASSKSGPGQYAITRGTITPAYRLVNYDLEEVPGELTVLDPAVIAEQQAKLQFEAATIPKTKIIEWAQATTWLDTRITVFDKLWKEMEILGTYVLKVTKLPTFPAAIVGIEAAKVEVDEIEDLARQVEDRIQAVEVIWARIEKVCEALSDVIDKVDQVCLLLPTVRVTIGEKAEDRNALQFEIPFLDQLPKARTACDLLLTKWTLAETQAGQIEPLVSTMKLMKVHASIVGDVVGNNQVADLAFIGEGYSGFRNHQLTADLKGWWSIRLGGETAGCAPVAIHRHRNGVLEVAMTAEHNAKNEYVKRTPATISATYSDFLVYKPTGGVPTSI